MYEAHQPAPVEQGTGKRNASGTAQTGYRPTYRRPAMRRAIRSAFIRPPDRQTTWQGPMPRCLIVSQAFRRSRPTQLMLRGNGFLISGHTAKETSIRRHIRHSPRCQTLS